MLGAAVKALVKLAKSPAVRRAVVKAAQKAGSFFKKVKRKVVEKCKFYQRNRKIRQGYNARKRQLKKELAEMKKQGKSPKERAEHAYKFRKNERLSAREEMRRNGDGDAVEKLQQRDLKKYGDKDGPTFDHTYKKSEADLQKKLGRKPTSDEVHGEIEKSATRTDVMTNIKFLTW